MKYLTSAITALLIIISYSVLLNLSKQTAFLDESGNGFIVKFPKILDFAARLNIIGGVLEFVYVRWNIVVDENKLTCNRIF